MGEGDAGTVAAVFEVTRSGSLDRPSSVRYATADGTAGAPEDYTATAGTLTFAAGQRTRTITVTVRGDLIDEADETFLVRLSEPVNATLPDNPQGLGTITDDDQAALPITDEVITEGTGEGGRARFTVTLSTQASSGILVDYETLDGTAASTSDYGFARGTLAFRAGETSKTVEVGLTGDARDEPEETFFVDLLNPRGATIADRRGTGTIADDDEPPAAPGATPTPGPTAAASPTPTATPTPTPTPAPRVAARSFDVFVSSRRRAGSLRITTTGRLGRPAGVTAEQGCRGRVAVQVKAGKRTVSTRRVAVDRRCGFRSRVTFRDVRRFGGARALRVFARYLGGDRLRPVRAPAVTVRTR